MTIDFKKEWKKILIDVGLSEREFYRQHDLSQPVWNRKINTGAIKLEEADTLLDKLGYAIRIEKKGN